MNKKIIALLLVVALASTGAVFAKTGVGVQGGYNFGGGAGAALTFKLDSLPCVFALDLGLGNGIAVAPVDAKGLETATKVVLSNISFVNTEAA